MPRRPRCYVPGHPVHVVQRGVDRQPCFFGTRDRRVYLGALDGACRRFRVALHAYVLMTNHVHLLVTPSDETGVSQVMQSLGRVYVRHVNDARGRTGTLWEGRHRDSLVQTDRYLLACMRYIDRNPVRAGLVDAPGAWPWSSHGQNSAGDPAGILTPHDCYRALGATPVERAKAYRVLFADEDAAGVVAFREGIRRRWPVGDPAFVRRLRTLGAPLGRPAAGRPAVDSVPE